MRVYNGNGSMEEDRYVLCLHILEYDDIIRQFHLIERISMLLRQYGHHFTPWASEGFPQQAHLIWEYVLTADTLVMVEVQSGQIQQVIEDAINLEIELASYGILVRGSLTYGHVCNLAPQMLVGEAFLHVLEMERYSLGYPRIVLDEDICGNYPLCEHFVKKTHIPGLYFLDYLYPYSRIKPIEGYWSFLRQMREMIRRGLAKYGYQSSERSRVDLDRYLWLQHYYQNNLLNLPPNLAREFSI